VNLTASTPKEQKSKTSYDIVRRASVYQVSPDSTTTNDPMLIEMT